MRVAAIDCGTNSIRLLVADASPVGGSADAGPAGAGPDGAGPAAGRLREVDRRMRIVRLGEGVDATGRLSEAALARTYRACEEYAAVLAQLRPDALRFVATSATRDAANADAFTDGVRDRLGVEPVVVSGAEEARLSFDGALAGLAAQHPAAPVLVVDIGGGSTEFVLGSPPRAPGGGVDVPPVGVSVDIGCVRLTERVLSGDPPDAAQLAAATALVDAAIEEADRTVPLADARTLVGLAGSVTSVGAAVLGLDAYDRSRIHHARLPADRVHEVTGSLLRATREERARLPWLHPGRVDVIGAGALVLDRVLARVGPTLAAPEVVVSEEDILDGIALSLL